MIVLTKSLLNIRLYIFMLFALMYQQEFIAQDDTTLSMYKNQVSTNLLLPVFGSVDLSYERTLNKKFAVGFAAAIYGDRIKEISVDDEYYERNLRTKNEVMPFVRVYFSGNQRKSHFLELFGSISGVDETGRLVRTVNDQGYGVYRLGTESFTRGGFGLGYGYRFLFLDGKLVGEAQFGLRTNFDVNFLVLNAALVRTGLKVGYRF